MTSARSAKPAPPVAIALVHGIGAVHPQDMIRSVSAALEPNLPGTELHRYIKVIDAADGVQICLKESRSGRPITIASAYWGDVCQVGESLFSVVGGLLTNIFGLRFFASAALRGGGPLRHLLWLMYVSIVWVTAVVTYPLNIVTMIFSVFLLAGFYLSTGQVTGTGYLGDLTYMAGFVAAAVTIWGAGALLRRQWPKRAEGGVYVPLLISILTLAALGVALLTVDHFKLAPLGDAAREAMRRYGTRVLDRRWVDLAESTDPRIVHVAVLSFLQVMAGIVVVLLTIAALPLTLFNYLVSGLNRRVARATLLALASCVAAWLFVLMITWPENIVTNLAISTVTRPKAYNTHWLEALLLAFVMLLGFTALLLVVLRGHGQSMSATRSLTDYAPRSPGEEPRYRLGPRLIFSSVIQGVLVTMAAVAIAISLSHLAELKLIPQSVPVREALINLGAMAVIAAFVLAAPVFRYGAKTLMDIIDHFTSYGDGFPVRKRISERLRVTVKHLLDTDGKPDLVIISHSQGTVVAVDALFDPHFQAFIADRVNSLTLLTFGTPFEHIYRHYFHADYPCELSPEFEEFAEKVRFRWTNTYRIDDYVGTMVGGSSRFAPDNVPLGLGGHVEYWRPEVFAELMKQGRIFRCH